MDIGEINNMDVDKNNNLIPKNKNNKVNVDNINNDSNNFVDNSNNSNSNNNILKNNESKLFNNNFDEFKDKLTFFSVLKNKEKEYYKIKNGVLQNMENIKSEDTILEDLYKERNSLIQEYKKYETILKDIQNDIFNVEALIIESKTHKEIIRKQLTHQRETEMYPLKDSIDEMRKSINLPVLPSIESEKDREMNEYLTNRLKEELEKENQKKLKQQQLLLEKAQQKQIYLSKSANFNNNNNNNNDNNNNNNNTIINNNNINTTISNTSTTTTPIAPTTSPTPTPGKRGRKAKIRLSQ
ncbi:hypothetical protein DICPUDRAFT_147920 [Dictyostelium purpureum]|uniref:Uncharacterized protein n=1 Tax=Dictyostelium purpureum TaxID=5786 RepID=F0Z9R9_DICPU|nr:uncharacterized protein DICPUDRAFT_147920 [Dictyostelium purpureum]EGC39293.1 hypothetical protein DICPUDRAFT_147920 [Dictyostelium purpureum]|eukprot:XP_003284197.1 hypothetical protein DICPUDRAFT_147920 [Dictyostelium purpureum]